VALPPDPGAGFQAHFHHRWNVLRDRHVRALAWLLEAPDLLDPAAPRWRGMLARLPDDPGLAGWLTALDRAPQPLRDWLDPDPRLRLGRYAEQLLGFYFQQHGRLAARNLQVRDGNLTIGEFDFLLRDGAALLHWELATKFYLLETGNPHGADYFVGPGLADMLGRKMDRMLERQLALGSHPAARACLPQPLAAARALVKGWLFYPPGVAVPAAAGLHPEHCRGFWRPLAQLDELPGEGYALLPRLDWLAPARLAAAEALDRAALRAALHAHFAASDRPLLVAVLDVSDGEALETARGFIVPDDWRERARKRIAALA